MYAPPPVRVQIERDCRWLLALALLAAAAAANATAWCLSPFDVGAAMVAAGAGVAAVFAAAAAAIVGWWRAPRGHLFWDGQGWFWESVGKAPLDGMVKVALDLDAWMLLRFGAPGGRCRWLPIARSGAATVWAPLRGALFEPHRSDRSTAPLPAGLTR